jgi:DHA2 family multidrug resistance protein-like MFS transporter
MAGVGPMVSLGYGVVLTAAPVERAGSASAVMETGGQFGIAVGIGGLGSLAAAVYREWVALPGGLPADAAAAARDSVAGGVAAGARLPDPLGAEVVVAVQDAFAGGVATVAVVSASVFVVLAVAAAMGLREIPPQRDLTTMD